MENHGDFRIYTSIDEVGGSSPGGGIFLYVLLIGMEYNRFIAK
jgi:hypothetical protein